MRIPWTREREPDPEVDAWDRHLAGDDSSALTSLITRLERAHRAPEPDAGFLTRLEDQMFASVIEKPQTVPRLPKPPFDASRIRPSLRLSKSWALVAATVALIMASLAIVALRDDRGTGSPDMVPAAVLQDSTPVASDSVGETLLSVTSDPAEIDSSDPATWDTHELFVVRLKSQESFSMDHPFFTCCPGTVVFHVLSGELTASSPGPSMVVDGDGRATPYESMTDQVLPSGEAMLVAGKTPAQIRNEGEEELTLLYFGAYNNETGQMSPPPFTYDAYTLQSIGEPLASGSLKFSLTMIALDPMETLTTNMLPAGHFAGLLAEGKLRFVSGEHESPPTDDKGITVGSGIWPSTGPIPLTYFNPEETGQTVIYVMQVAQGDVLGASALDSTPEAAPTDSTRVAADSVGETLLNVTFDPADIESADPATWEAHELWVAQLKSQESFSLEHTFFSCCPGTMVFQVLAGEMTVASPGSVLVVDGTGQSARHESTTDQVIAPGETVLISSMTPAEMRNDGQEELTLVYWGGFFNETGNLNGAPFASSAWTNQAIEESLATGSLELTLTRIVLDPMESVTTTMMPAGEFAGLVSEGYLRFIAGEHESVPAGEKGVAVGSSIWPVSGPVPLTYFNPDESGQTVIYLMQIEEAESA